MKKITFVLGFMFALSTSSFAQNQTEFQKFISNTFEQKLTSLDNPSEVPDFLKSFSQDLSWREVTIAIDGKIEIPELYSKSDLEQKINFLARRSGISISWEIMQYNELTNRENSYIASMNVKVKLYANGEIIKEGTNNVQIVAEKKASFYQIKYMDVLQISQEQYLGNCYVRIASDNERTYAVDIAYPNGNNYENDGTKITVVSLDSFKKLVIDGNPQAYYWNTLNNEVSLKKEGQKLGVASTIENVILIAVKNEGKNTCSSVIRTAAKK